MVKLTKKEKAMKMKEEEDKRKEEEAKMAANSAKTEEVVIIMKPEEIYKDPVKRKNDPDGKKPGTSNRFLGGFEDKGFKDAEKEMQEKEKGIMSKMFSTVKDSFSSIGSEAKKVLTSMSDKIEGWAKVQIEKVIKRLLAKGPPITKKKLKNKHMCVCVKNMIDDLVDDIWPEIEEEVIIYLRFKYDYMEEFEFKGPKSKPCCCCCGACLRCLRNKYLYTLDPVDKNIWQQIKDPLWWLILLITLVPIFGVQPLMYAIMFMCINKRDEFQLLKFILKFKRKQFITSGIIKGVMGFTMYYSCVNFTEAEKDEETNKEYQEHACEKYGPGFGTYYYWEVVAHIGMIVLTWVGALCLYGAKKTGQPRFRFLTDEDGEIHKDNLGNTSKKSCLCKCCFKADDCKGGRIWCFMIYDSIIFLLCCITFFLLTRIMYSKEQDWQGRADVYWASFTYGILAFPFLLFTIPLCQVLITKARETAYDREGNLLPKYVCEKKYIQKWGKVTPTIEPIDDSESDQDEESPIRVDRFDKAL